jgi:DNA helicase-2/ATP-dependent DNA helicase PcrA
MDLLEGLNDKQKEAVLCTEGPLLILAGAGSGKTRVLTHRIAYIIEEKGVFPGNILAITFTNKAANEMKERLGALLGDRVDNLWVGTFHSICVRILRRNIDRIGYNGSFVIYDQTDQKTVVKECIKEMNLDKETFKEKSAINLISSQKNSMISPDEYINENYSDFYNRRMGEIYALYEKKLKSNNALDFDDLLLKTLELFEKAPDVLDYYQKRFQYIFVDEYQDTNKVQYELIKYLSKRYKNLCVVGDDDQSIYGWRGADIKNILDFEKDFPDAKVIKLEQNYRSTKNILDVANSIIKNNYGRKDKSLWTSNGEGEKARIFRAMDEIDEAYFVANEVEKLTQKGYKLSDIAILYRTNAQSRVFEEAFMKKSISYKIVGGLKFYDRKEVKDILGYLKVIQNPLDDVSMKRIINVPKRGIGNATIDKIESYTSKTGESIYSALLGVEDIDGLSKRAMNNLRSFIDMINKFIDMKDKMGLKDFIEEVMNQTGYIEELEKENTVEAEGRIENLKEFISVAMDFEMHNENATLEEFLVDISLLTDLDKTEESPDSVTLMTVHSAKGLEFPIVFMVGMEEGLFPIRRAMESDLELEEERRLCYVAITRAEKLLYITHANVRTLYGNVSVCLPSSFLKEIPMEMIIDINNEKKKNSSQRTIDKQKSNNIEFIDKVKKPNVDRKIDMKEKLDIDAGDKVKHKVFGIGTVVQVKRTENDAEIVIAFENKGIKKLLLSIAPIEKI